jgi:hypothetical protein
MFDEIKKVDFKAFQETGIVWFMSYRDEKFKLEIVDHNDGCPKWQGVSLDYWLHGQGWINIIQFSAYGVNDSDINNLMEIAYMFIPAYVKPMEGNFPPQVKTKGE